MRVKAAGTWRAAGPFLVALGVALGTGASAQEEVRLELEGQVLLGDAPLPGISVVLHRVSQDSAGELDSLVADAEGRFRFELPGVPDPGGQGRVYFASVRHQGILYFGPALSRPVQLDSLYTIRAWDTVPAPAGGAVLPVAVRYLVLEPADEEGWHVTDLFELDVDAGGTLVAGEGGVTWSHPLPADARELDPFGSELTGGSDPSGPRVVDGRVTVRAPLSPGPRQFVLRYAVPDLDGLEIPFATATGEVEMLVREPAPDLTVTGLDALESVEMQPGVAYRRYVGSFAEASTVTIQAAPPPFTLPLEWVAVVLALFLGLAGVYAVRRGQDRPVPAGAPVGTPGPDAPELRQQRLLEVARLDEALEDENLSPAERVRLQERRAALVARLRLER